MNLYHCLDRSQRSPANFHQPWSSRHRDSQEFPQALTRFSTRIVCYLRRQGLRCGNPVSVKTHRYRFPAACIHERRQTATNKDDDHQPTAKLVLRPTDPSNNRFVECWMRSAAEAVACKSAAVPCTSCRRVGRRSSQFFD